MESLKEILRKTGKASILESIIFGILGIILFCNPVGTVRLIAGILGTIFIAIGISKIINYFISRGNNHFLNCFVRHTILLRLSQIHLWWQ